MVTLFALCDAVAQEKSIAEQAAEYIEADNKRRGYTNIELMEMRIKVSRERTSELVVNVLAERMKSAHASAVENSVISSSKEDAVKYMETFISRTGACVLFHAAQRDDVISHGSDASHCEKKRKKMAGAFVYQSKALGEIINDPTFEKQAIEEFNTNYEENIKEWTGASTRCVLLEKEKAEGTCPYCGEVAKVVMYFSRSH